MSERAAIKRKSRDVGVDKKKERLFQVASYETAEDFDKDAA